MNWFKEVWMSIRNKDEVVDRHGKEILTDETPLGWNIYLPENTSRKDYAKKFHKVHYGLKYKLLVPALIIAQKFALPKYQHVSIKPDEYNREMRIFERSYNEAMEDMLNIYYLEQNIQNNITPEQNLHKLRYDRDTLRHLKTIKQGTLSITQMDGWYHEFGTFLMHRIYKNMAKNFDGRTYNRITYTSKSIADVHWLMMQKKVNYDVLVTDATKYLKDRVTFSELGLEEM